MHVYCNYDHDCDMKSDPPQPHAAAASPVCVVCVLAGKEKALGLLLYLLETLGSDTWDGNVQGLGMVLEKLALQFRETQVNAFLATSVCSNCPLRSDACANT